MNGPEVKAASLLLQASPIYEKLQFMLSKIRNHHNFTFIYAIKIIHRLT
jgi:hypothetical protein